MQNNTTIIIPILNEGRNIGLLIDKIFYLYKNINVLIVDDFSTDNGVKIVNSKIDKYQSKLNIYVKNNKKYKGLTNSIILGIRHIKTEYFIIMDGDFQHPVNNIQDFINLFKKGKNLVIGEREKIVFNEKKYKIFISKLGNLLINLRIKKKGFKLKDPLTGFFGGARPFFMKNINKNEEVFIGTGYKFLFDFLKIIRKLEVNLGTFSFNFGKRRFGISNISSKIYIDFIKGLLK